MTTITLERLGRNHATTDIVRHDALGNPIDSWDIHCAGYITEKKWIKNDAVLQLKVDGKGVAKFLLTATGHGCGNHDMYGVHPQMRAVERAINDHMDASGNWTGPDTLAFGPSGKPEIDPTAEAEPEITTEEIAPAISVSEDANIFSDTEGLVLDNLHWHTSEADLARDQMLELCGMLADVSMAWVGAVEDDAPDAPDNLHDMRMRMRDFKAAEKRLRKANDALTAWLADNGTLAGDGDGIYYAVAGVKVRRRMDDTGYAVESA